MGREYSKSDSCAAFTSFPLIHGGNDKDVSNRKISVHPANAEQPSGP
jgi:hypothetical protein